MPNILQSQIQETPGVGAFVNDSVRFTNQIGTPLISATDLQTGEAIADSIALTFASVVPATSALVKVQGSPNNPYNESGGISINLDGTTIYKEIIPGTGLVFSSAGGFSSLWTAQVRLGSYLGLLNAWGVTAGSPGTPVKHRVMNNAGSPAQSCIVGLRNVAVQVKTLGSIFASIQQFAAGSTMKLSSGSSAPYHITVANVTGSGSAKTVDVEVDGATVTVLDPNTSTSIPSTGLHCDARVYKVQSGGLTDLVFVLDSAVVNSSTANVLVFSAADLQIAPDVTGAPGSWGTSDVPLTQVGQSSGVILSTGFADFWMRPLVMTTSNALSNPYCFSPMLQGSETQSALWML